MRTENFFTKPFWLAFFLNVLFFGGCLGIGGIHFGSLDDYFMSAVITGGYGGNFDAHTLFVNGAYAYFLKPFYTLFPEVGWYFIFEMFFVFASFVVFTYFLLKQNKGLRGIVLSCVLLASVAPDYYLQLAFTQCAAISTSAGILLLYFGCSEKQWKCLLVAIPFVIAGMVFRREGFLLGVPFLIAILFFNTAESRRIYKPILALIPILIVIFFSLQTFNNNLFENNEYTYYRDYQNSRATFGDGANYDVNAVYDELEELQYQGRDFRYLRSWVFYDTEIFSLDSLRPYMKSVSRNRYLTNYARMPIALFVVVANSFFKSNAWCWALFCLILLYYSPKKAYWYVSGSLVLICLCLSYLLLANRVVYHVESGIWLYAIVCAIPFLRESDFEKKDALKRTFVLLFVFAMGTFILALSNQRRIDNNRCFFGIPEMPAEWKSFEAYTREHPNDVFLLYFNEYKIFATYKDPPYKSVKPHSWGNIIPIGYWNINLPGMKKELAERGIGNPIGELVKDNVYVLEQETLLRFDYFYEKHYHMNVVVDTVRCFGNLALTKYKVREDKH